jgi:hypothetical protein
MDLVLAHGLSGRADLPLPLGVVVVAAIVALAVSFAITAWFWPVPRLARQAVGHELRRTWQGGGRVLVVILRALGLALFALILVACFFGEDAPGLNIAPTLVFIWFWVGLQVVSAGAGDVWRALSPYETVSLVASRLRPRGSEHTDRVDPGHWTAAALLASFAWLELAYFDSDSPRAIGVWLAVYSVAVLAGAAWWGRGWLRHGEGFAGVFGLIAHMGLFFATERRFRWRWPVTGLATIRIRRGTAALLMVALGSTAFDGVSNTDLWLEIAADQAGWSRAALSTVGLAWIIGLVAVIYIAATRITARVAGVENRVTIEAFLPSLVPIALGYAIAHYFSLLVFEGQQAYALASDPFGQGWDLFGTYLYNVDYQWLSARVVSLVQASAIVGGHIIGVLVAHDCAVELFPPEVAVKSQYSLLIAMVIYTVGGLLLLLA